MINKNFHVILVFLSGILFLIGECFVFAVGWRAIVADLLRITTQSNLFSFILVTVYLLKPDLQIFKNNLLFLFVGGLLLTACFGFWFFVFPIYFINSDQFLFDDSEYNYRHAKSIQLLCALWNHFFVQVFYLNMIKHIFKSQDRWKLFPVSYRQCLNFVIKYWFLTISLYIFVSWWDIIYPSYGMLSNFNWNTNFKTLFGVKLFDVNMLFTSTLVMIIICYLSITYLWWISIKLNPFTCQERQMNINIFKKR